jgi:hypothetical protein
VSLDAMANVADIFGPLLAIAALVWGFWTFKRELRFGHYTELDRLYLDVVALRIKEGDRIASNPSAAHDYALLVWNFIEAIHDRCGKDKVLTETWRPIIEQEGKAHAAWFAANKSFFKRPFQKWVERAFPETTGATSETRPME